jgi:hypothetical protein
MSCIAMKASWSQFSSNCDGDQMPYILAVHT